MNAVFIVKNVRHVNARHLQQCTRFIACTNSRQYYIFLNEGD